MHTTEKKHAILQFTNGAILNNDIHHAAIPKFDAEINACIQWRKQSSNTDVRKFREEAICEIEQMGANMWKEMQPQKWMASSDPCVQQISCDVNGPLIQTLLDRIEFHDKDCVNIFKHGVPIAGDLPRQGGEDNKLNASLSISELWSQLHVRNIETVKKLREDKHASELYLDMKAEAQQGRMTDPKPLQAKDLECCLLAKRFSVEQGTRSDGSLKIRAVDDETASGLNMCTEGGDKIKCDSLDQLVKAIQQLSYYEGGFKKLGLWKADIKSAFRRLPIQPEQRWLAWVVLTCENVPYIARHNSCMFGAAASVMAWDRVGEMIKAVCLKILKIPVFRWVDDFFSAEPEGALIHCRFHVFNILCVL